MTKPDCYRHQPKHVAGSIRRIKLCLGRVCVIACLGILNVWAGVDPGVVGPETYTIWAGGGAPALRKRTQNYEHKIRYESEYLFRMRKKSHNKLRI